ncbi:MAG: hypothetical protein EOO27_29355, partial [Comamonadaceae bacterium]
MHPIDLRPWSLCARAGQHFIDLHPSHRPSVLHFRQRGHTRYHWGMFSYRHAFHAGNHADVLKHTVLITALQH